MASNNNNTTMVCLLGPPGVVTGKGFIDTQKADDMQLCTWYTSSLSSSTFAHLYLQTWKRQCLEMRLPKRPLCKPSSMDRTSLAQMHLRSNRIATGQPYGVQALGVLCIVDSQQHTAKGPVRPMGVVGSSLSPSAQQPPGTRPMSAEHVILAVRPAPLQHAAKWSGVHHGM